MEIHCAYWGRHEFYGIEIYEDDINSPTSQNDWEYHQSDDYFDFVIDCLNQNFYSIAACGEPYILPDRTSSDIDKLHELTVEDARRRCANKQLDGFIDYLESQRGEIKRRYKLTKDDLSGLDLEYYRKFIELSNSSDYPNLSLKEKYYAYYMTSSSRFLATDFRADISIDPSANGDDALTSKIAAAITTTKAKGQAQSYEKVCAVLNGEDKVSASVGKSYKFHSLRDTFIFLFHEMISDEILVKNCTHCGRYFVPERNGQVVCDMPSPQVPEKSCQEYVKYQKYLEKSHTEASKLHKQIYNQKANKVKRTGNVLLQADLERFKEQSEQWRADVRDGIKREENYIQWLKDVKENGL